MMINVAWLKYLIQNMEKEEVDLVLILLSNGCLNVWKSSL